MNENCKLKIPSGIKVTEAEIVRIWIEEDVVYSISKPVRRNMDNLREYFEVLRSISGGKKIFMISETNEMQPYSKKEKEYFNEELQKICKGLAAIACKPLGKILPAVVILSHQPSFPVKIFTDPAEAKKWIQELKNTPIPDWR